MVWKQEIVRKPEVIYVSYMFILGQRGKVIEWLLLGKTVESTFPFQKRSRPVYNRFFVATEGVGS